MYRSPYSSVPLTFLHSIEEPFANFPYTCSPINFLPLSYFCCSNMLKMGKSRHWLEAYKMLTGSTKFDATSIKAYFQPLYTWMQQQRAKEKYSIGWDHPKPNPTPSNSFAIQANFYVIVCLLVIAKLLN